MLITDVLAHCGTVAGKIRTDLKYQADDEFIMMDAAVLCLSFSRDSEMLATGSDSGQLCVWQVATGRRLRRFEAAHEAAIAAVQFSKDSSHLLTASNDHTARLHGLKSAKTIRQFRGHTAFVNAAIYSSDGHQVITGASDGSLRVFNARTSECTATMSLSVGGPPGSVALESLQLMPQNQDHVLVCGRSNAMVIVSLQGDVRSAF